MKTNRKSLSPIISTAALIMIVIVIAIIILLLYSHFKGEEILKFSGESEKPIDDVCREVSIKIIKNKDGSFGFQNTGNIPIYAVELKLSDNSGTILEKVDEEGGGKVDIGISTILKKSDGSNYNYNDYNEIKIIPILYGKTMSDELRQHVCPEETGVEV